jgi:hypothetical protein
MDSSGSKKPGLPSRGPLPKSDVLLLISSLVALVLSSWTPFVLAMSWPREWAGPVFAMGVLVAPCALGLSAWELFRYRISWRGLVAAFLSAFVTALWGYTVVEIIHHAGGS